MPEAKKGSFIPYHWVDEISYNEDGIKDEEYSKEVAWELLKALTAQGRGEEIIWPKDRYLKAIIRGYLQQENVMQKNIQTFSNTKKGELSDAERDEIIYTLYLEDKKAPEIMDILNKQYGCSYIDHSFIYKTKGWLKGKENKIQLNSADQTDSAENKEKSVEYDF